MKKLALIAALLLLAAVPMAAVAQQTTGPEWHLSGTGPVKLIGGYGDNMVYDGSTVRDATGSVEMHLNSDTDTGSIVATFTVDKFQPSADLTFENAMVTLIYPAFGMPGGMGMPEYWEGGVADSTHLHGDTGQEAPIVPSVNTPVATWGPVMVFVNGKKLEGNPDMMGAFLGHMMYTDRVRDPKTQQLLKADGTCCYSPMDPSNGSVVDPNSYIVHIIARSDMPDDNNFPKFSFFIHVNYETVADAEAKMIPNIKPDDLLAMDPADAQKMMMSMMPPAALPTTGGSSATNAGGSLGALALAGLLLAGAGLGLRRWARAVR